MVFLAASFYSLVCCAIFGAVLMLVFASDDQLAGLFLKFPYRFQNVYDVVDTSRHAAHVLVKIAAGIGLWACLGIFLLRNESQ